MGFFENWDKSPQKKWDKGTDIKPCHEVHEFGIIFTHIGGLRLRLMSAASLASENYETLKYKAVCGCSILGHT